MAVATTLFCTTHAHAAGSFVDGLYAGLGYHHGIYDSKATGKSDIGGAKLKAGKYIFPYLAIETHLLFGTRYGEYTPSSEESGFSDNTHHIDLENAFSIFLKGDFTLPTPKETRIYGLLGFSQVKSGHSSFNIVINRDDGNVIGEIEEIESDSDAGLSFGAGAEINLSKDLYLSGEHISYISDSDFNYSGFNLGLHKRF